jgi:ubiquinone/menaquinone biosynthesis C-methylase UbiE
MPEEMRAEGMNENEKGLVDRAAILERWNVRNKRVLDLGAGPLAIVAARDFNCRVTTIDISEEKLQAVRRDAEMTGLSEKISFEHGDACALSYPDRSFEVVIGYGLLHHLEPARREGCIREAVRVARELVIFAEMNAEGFKKIHELDEFTRVDLGWLERVLDAYGHREKYRGRLMNVYALPR